LEVSVPDLIRLGLADEEEAAVSLRDLGKRLQKEKWIQAFNQKTQIFVISQRANSDCIFLHEKTRLCTVYAKRPEVCRQFPKIGPRPGFCPAGPKSKSD